MHLPVVVGDGPTGVGERKGASKGGRVLQDFHLRQRTLSVVMTFWQVAPEHSRKLRCSVKQQTRATTS